MPTTMGRPPMPNRPDPPHGGLHGTVSPPLQPREPVAARGAMECLDNAAIEDLAQARLSREDDAAAVLHLNSCEDCSSRVAEALAPQARTRLANATTQERAPRGRKPPALRRA